MHVVSIIKHYCDIMYSISFKFLIIATFVMNDSNNSKECFSKTCIDNMHREKQKEKYLPSCESLTVSIPRL